MCTLGNLHFEQIAIHDIKPTKRYMTLLKKSAIKNGSYWLVGNVIVKESSLLFTDFNVILHQPHSIKKCKVYYNKKLNVRKTCNLFTLHSSKQKIQDDMENRALQLVLKRIVNDPYFTW
jgi:hypothetical protein